MFRAENSHGTLGGDDLGQVQCSSYCEVLGGMHLGYEATSQSILRVQVAAGIRQSADQGGLADSVYMYARLEACLVIKKEMLSFKGD